MRESELCTRKEIELKKGYEFFTIRHISDTHHGADSFNKELFYDFVRLQRRDKNSAWIHTGDIVDADRPSMRALKAVMYSDRRDALSHEDRKDIEWLRTKVVPMYRDIVGSCLGVIDGDHFLVFKNGTTSGQWLAKYLKVPYLGERSGFVNIVFKAHNCNEKLQYVIHARHGKGTTSNHGSDVNALVRQESAFLADLHLGGHTHRENCHPQRLRYISRKGFIKDKMIWYVRGGSFLDNPQYARKAEYSPLPCGYAEVKLKIQRPNIGVCNPLTITQSQGTIKAA